MQIYQNIWILFLVASILIQGLKYFESPFTKKKKKKKDSFRFVQWSCCMLQVLTSGQWITEVVESPIQPIRYLTEWFTKQHSFKITSINLQKDSWKSLQ